MKQRPNRRVLQRNPLLVEVVVDPEVDLPVSEPQLVDAVRAAAAFRGCDRGEIGVRVTDDPQIREINRTHLDHDYETDVISFTYVLEPPQVEGELVVSVDTARRRAVEIGWEFSNELLLYVVHGSLHVAGMDDRQPEQRAAMREAERDVMHQLGISQIDRFAPDRAETRDGGAETETPRRSPVLNQREESR